MADRVDEPFVQVIADKLECKNPIVIGGFPGMGLVGNIVTQYLLDQLNMKSCGRVDSRLFPPIAILYGGLVKGPVRIYENPEKEVVIVFSDIPIDPLISREVGRTLVNWFKTINPKEVVTIAGLATMTQEHKVFGAAGRQEDLDRIKDHLNVFEVGTISGVPGVIMNECMNNDIPSVCLLGETSGPNPDPRAAIEVTKVMNTLYGFNVDIHPLEEQAEQIELMMHKLSEQVGEAEARPVKDKKEFSIYG